MKGIEFVKDNNIGMDADEMSRRFVKYINLCFSFIIYRFIIDPIIFV